MNYETFLTKAHSAQEAAADALTHTQDAVDYATEVGKRIHQLESVLDGLRAGLDGHDVRAGLDGHDDDDPYHDAWNQVNALIAKLKKEHASLRDVLSELELHAECAASHTEELGALNLHGMCDQRLGALVDKVDREIRERQALSDEAPEGLLWAKELLWDEILALALDRPS